MAPAPPDTYTLSLHDALPILRRAYEAGLRSHRCHRDFAHAFRASCARPLAGVLQIRSEEHTSELQSRGHLVCRLLLEKKKKKKRKTTIQRYDIYTNRHTITPI